MTSCKHANVQSFSATSVLDKSLNTNRSLTYVIPGVQCTLSAILNKSLKASLQAFVRLLCIFFYSKQLVVDETLY